MRLTNVLKKAKKFYSGRGEEFNYWKRFIYRIQQASRGPVVYKPIRGWVEMGNKKEWHYDESPPYSQRSENAQNDKEMPLVEPLKNWNIFLGDRVEVLVGKDKGKIGEVVQIVKERNWFFVEGLHLQYSHLEDNKYKDKPYLEGHKILTIKEQPLLNTEIQLIDPTDQKATDIEWRYGEDGVSVRVSVRTGRIIPIPIKHYQTWEDNTNSKTYKSSDKDTADRELTRVTYTPKLCTFEEDIAKSLGVKHEKLTHRTRYWY